ncbi:MAG: hypothetical protein CME65_11050 [Halobacteriovoraceae bacterium]|nr:hypothetical protein [Halobacteriovoraceae bacterium]
MKFLGFLLLFMGCSTTSPDKMFGDTLGKEETFQLVDANGSYLVKREVKYSKGRMISRLRYFDKDGVTQLENTVAVSRVGRLKNQKSIAVLPEASQYKVWFEKEEHFSQAKVIASKKKIAVNLEGPSPQWEGVKEFDLPKTRYICFFSQLPECLKLQKLLIKSARQPVSLYVLWDNFPYHNELYVNLGSSITSLATLSVNNDSKDEFKFNLDIGSQILFFHYDKNLNFTKMFWVAQGISMVKFGG